MAQTVTVTGVDDAVVDGPQAYLIVTAPAVSTDPNYTGANAADVAVSNTDNDSAGITVTPTAGLVTTEAARDGDVYGGAQHAADGGRDDRADARATRPKGRSAPASLTFTTANWNVAQTVTVTGVDDALVDGPQAYLIVTAAAVSTDPNYTGANAADVAVSNTDNDSAGITVTPTAGLVTTEARRDGDVYGGAQYAADGGRDDRADSSDTTEGTVGPASLVFTTANWNVAQTVTVTGVDDAVVDGPQAYIDRDGPGGEHRPELHRRQCRRRGGEQYRQRQRGDHGDADGGAGDDRSAAGRRRLRWCSTRSRRRT